MNTRSKRKRTGCVALNRKEITGQRFGRLLVIRPVRKSGDDRLYYFCQCDCGNDCTVLAQSLRTGNTSSCGCLRRERLKAANTSHGKSHTTIHNTWLSMLKRCEDPDCKAYPTYGGRGINVCERWHDFARFYADMGDAPQKGMTLDRYPNNNGDYEPGNVRWATKKEQANNRRSNRLLTFQGRTQTIAQWEDEMGWRRGTINNRLQVGWTVERAITTDPAAYRS